jgi:hypothetical protein
LHAIEGKSFWNGRTEYVVGLPGKTTWKGMNGMDNVFISSTFEDLKEERKEVVDALLQIGCTPVAMEFFPAFQGDSWTYISNLIKHVDYLVLIVGEKYGTPNKNGISMTEREYDLAQTLGKPMGCFLYASHNPQQPPIDPRLVKFKKKIASKNGYRTWKDKDTLGREIIVAIDKFKEKKRIRKLKIWLRNSVALVVVAFLVFVFGSFYSASLKEKDVKALENIVSELDSEISKQAEIIIENEKEKSYEIQRTRRELEDSVSAIMEGSSVEAGATVARPESFYCVYSLGELKELRQYQTGGVHARSNKPSTYGHAELEEYIMATPGWEIDAEAINIAPIGSGIDYSGQSEIRSGDCYVRIVPSDSWSWREDDRGKGTRIVEITDITTKGFRVKAHLSTNRSSANPFAGKENGWMYAEVGYLEILPKSSAMTAESFFDNKVASVDFPIISPDREIRIKNIIAKYPDGSEISYPPDGGGRFDVNFDAQSKLVTIKQK